MSKQVQGVVGYRSKVDAKGRPLQSWPSQHADRLDNVTGRYLYKIPRAVHANWSFKV